MRLPHLRASRLAAGAATVALVAGGVTTATVLPTAAAGAAAVSAHTRRSEGPRLEHVSSSISPGRVLHGTLNATVQARSCVISALGPYEGQRISWSVDAHGQLLRLALHVKRDATPGLWRLRAHCVINGLARSPTARARVHVLGTGGHGLIANRSGLRVRRVRSTRQTFRGSSAAADKRTKRVKIVLGGRGGSSDPGDDYPAKWKNAPQDSVIDNWRMYNRECVSFVAWALASRNGFDVKTVLAPGQGNADEWPGQASAHGYRVNHTPGTGSVAYFAVGSYGHVAYVQRVSGSNVYLEQYNADYHGHYSTETIPASAVTDFIHFKDLTAVPPPPPPPSTTTTTTTPTTTTTTRVRVNAYSNYGSGATGIPMCRGNPGFPNSMPGGTVSETFTVPSGVASLDQVKVQIDPDSRVTGHGTLSVNGQIRATATAAAAGDTVFNFASVAVSPGDHVTFSVTFSATYGQIITIYEVGNPGGTFAVSNTCPNDQDSLTTGSSGLRAVVSGWSE
jgi:surface antigen